MSAYTINAQERQETGKGAMRRTRRSGHIPAVLYRSGEPAKLITIPKLEMDQLLRSTNNRNTLVNLQLNGGAFSCLMRDIQRHPVSQVIEHLDFFDISQTDAVTVNVPVVTTGRAAGVRAGGTLQLLTRKLQLRCSPAAIPGQIEVDVSDLEIGKFIRASQVTPPSGSTLIYRRDFNVVSVVGRRDQAAAAAPAAAAAAPAAKAAAPAAKAAAPAAKAAAPAAKPAAKK